MKLVVGLSLFPALWAPSTARADGKFYFRDEVPAKEPYQRAVLAWQDGQELLVIQPHLLGNAKDFVWVVPVPNEPKMAAMKATLADEYFGDLARVSTPRVVSLRQCVLTALLVGYLIVFFIVRRKIPTQRHPVVLLLHLLFVVIIAGFMVPPLHRGIRPVAEESAVSVLQREKLGIYDTQVVRSNEPGAMQGWLAKNGYRDAAEDDATMHAYEEKGWCFVVSRISVELKKDEINEGLIDAIVLVFPSTDPVYPFALTATNTHETLVVLYAFADNKLSHPALDLQFATPAKFGDLTPGAWRDPDDPGRPSIPTYEQDPTFLTKLKGRLSRQTAPGDIVLKQAPDDTPYRGWLFRW